MINNAGGFFAGLLLGGLARAGAMVLLASQSGKQTRSQIQHKSIELRDQMVGSEEGVVAQARVKAHRITAGVHEKAEELQQRGQDMLEGQRERLSTIVSRRGKKQPKVEVAEADCGGSD